MGWLHLLCNMSYSSPDLPPMKGTIVPSKVAHHDEGEHGDEAERYRPGYELVAERLLQYIAQENLRPGDRPLKAEPPK